MLSLLKKRSKSFGLDLLIVTIITILFFIAFTSLNMEPSDKTMNKVSKYSMQIYYLLCLIFVPLKTIGMKYFKLDFVGIEKNEVTLWGILKFYFFQMFFITMASLGFVFIISGNGVHRLYGALLILLGLLDLVPIFMKKDYTFLHDKIAKIKIIGC